MQRRQPGIGCSSAARLTAVELPSLTDPTNPAAAGPRYVYRYDANGNRTDLFDPTQTPGDASNPDDPHTTFAFDHKNRQISRTLPMGETEYSFFDDRSLAQVDAAGEFRATSTALGQLAFAIDFEGRVTERVYDNSVVGGGRLVQTRYYGDLGLALSASTTLADVRAAIDALDPDPVPAETVTYAYDALGRTTTTTQTFADGSSIITDRTYDSDGRLTRIVTDGEAVNYAYDDLGRTTRVFTGNDPSPRCETLYSYDDLGRLATVTASRRFSQPVAAGETTSYTYDLVGNLDAAALPGGVVSDYVYDDLNRLELLVQYGPGEVDGAAADTDWTNNEILASYDYLLRADGRRLGVIELADGGVASTNADLTTTRYAWRYDSLNRLVEEAYDGIGTGDDYITRYSFDDAGNRLLLERDASPASAFGSDAGGFLTTVPSAFTADSTTTSVYDDNDRLLSEATDEDTDSVIDEFIQYDYAGTVQAAKTVHDGADAAAPVAERTDYSYNARGRQDKVEIDNDGDATVDVTTEYLYSDAGIRFKQVVTQAGQASSTTEFVIDASNPTGYAQTIEEITDSSVTKSYTLGLDVISQAINDSGLTGTLQTYLYDGHGSVRQLVDAVGQVVKAALDSIGGAEVLKLDYNAYGQAINFAAATAVSSLLYNGEFTDATTGQQYLRARFYDPATGRFNRVDPFAGDTETPQSFHKYLYGLADPITYSDPSGEIPAILAIVAPVLVYSLIVGLFAIFASRTSAFLANIESIGTFAPVDAAKLNSLHHSVRISNSRLTADQMFTAMTNFRSRDMGPVLASENARPGNSIGFTVNANSVFSAAMALGQHEYFVGVTQYSKSNRKFTVQTYTGHPVAGWRHWRLIQASNGDLIIETFSVEHPSASIVEGAKQLAGGKAAQRATWNAYLSDLATISGGSVVQGRHTDLQGTTQPWRVGMALPWIQTPTLGP